MFSYLSHITLICLRLCYVREVYTIHSNGQNPQVFPFFGCWKADKQAIEDQIQLNNNLKIAKLEDFISPWQYRKKFSGYVQGGGLISYIRTNGSASLTEILGVGQLANCIISHTARRHRDDGIFRNIETFLWEAAWRISCWISSSIWPVRVTFCTRDKNRTGQTCPTRGNLQKKYYCTSHIIVPRSWINRIGQVLSDGSSDHWKTLLNGWREYLLYGSA